MKRRLLGAVCACVSMCALCGGAHAAFFSDVANFEVANPGLTTLDFEGLAPAGRSAPYSTPGYFTISPGHPGHHLLVIDKDFRNILFPPAPSDYLCAPCVNNGVLDMSFNVAVDAVSFDLAIAVTGNAAGGGNVNVNVFNDTTLLGSQVFSVGGVDDFDTFVGFSGLGTITRFTVSRPTDDSGSPIPGAFHNVDNLSYRTVVPVPAAFYLFGSGLLGLIGVARRRAE